MMKRITLLLILIFVNLIINSQTLQINWQQCFGGSESDYAMDLLESNNGFFILGNTYSNDGDVSLNHGVNDLWLVRIDSVGSLLWEKSYGGTESDGSHRIIDADSNYIYLLGGALSSDCDVTFDPYINSLDYWIVKIDSLGNIIWDKIVGGNGHDQLWTGTATIDGGIVAIGWTNSEDGDVSVHYDSYDIWMVKLNSQGEIAWDFTIGNNYLDFGHAIIQTSDGGFLIGGTSKITEGGNLNCQSHGEADGVLIKLDSLRNIEWQNCYGGSDYDGILALLEIEDGYLFSAYGGSNDGDLTGSGWHGEDDIWIVKIDIDGNIIWQKCFGGSKYEFANSFFQNDNGEITVIGYTESTDGDVIGNHTLYDIELDIWVMKLSDNGELLWQQCIGGIRSEYLDFGVIKKDDNNFIIAGQSNFGPSYDVQCGPLVEEFSDFWVFEIDSLDTTGAIENHYEISIRIKSYPL